MSTKEWEMGEEKKTNRFLTAAEYFLRQRNFADCCEYAQRAGDSEVTKRKSTQILSIASALSVPSISSSQNDYYKILNLPYFESDASRIKSKFEALATILHPNVNPYPHASEASFLVSEAWSVLSNPVKKARFDEELKMSFSGGKERNSFWTICRYCYYVYEYEMAYEGCCLRCSNERCRKVLHAAVIGVPPPPEVVQRGYYWCPGFMPLEVRKRGGEEIGENFWVPFSTPSTQSSDHTSPSNGSGFAGNGKEMILRDGMRKFCADEHLDNGGTTQFWGGNEDSASLNSSNFGRGFMSNGDPLCGESYKIVNGVDSGVEFYDGDDDLMVGFRYDFDGEPGLC